LLRQAAGRLPHLDSGGHRSCLYSRRGSALRGRTHLAHRTNQPPSPLSLIVVAISSTHGIWRDLHLSKISNRGRRCVAPGLTWFALISHEPQPRFAQAVCTLLAEMCRFSGSTPSQLRKMRPWQPHIPSPDEPSLHSSLFNPQLGVLFGGESVQFFHPSLTARQAVAQYGHPLYLFPARSLASKPSMSAGLHYAEFQRLKQEYECSLRMGVPLCLSIAGPNC
jgi:hypothetical protein